ncbi:tyrosine-type recombinase/integrase [Virgibacillus halodenitrificans]|uniref:tyrosine-type recombinase/integrase n=1 Tax=Virgibacillus halodenitrificans TaxID=1482 RepID=UPI000EF4CF0E|nr:tyrosine-type recombinase/integrase [Virgibacillus halodenitrificans]
MASYQRRGENSFLLVVEAGYTATGKRKKRTKTIRVEDEKLLRTTKRLKDYIEKELYIFQSEVEAGQYIKPEKLKLNDFVDMWHKKHAEKILAVKTHRSYREKLDNYILPYLGHKKLEEIKPMHIVDFLDYVSQPGSAIRTKQLSDSTIYEIDKTLRVVLNKAVEWQLLNKSPMDGLSRPKIKKKKMKYYDEDDVIQFLQAMYKENIVWRLLFITSAISGMRRGEVVGLRWSDYYFEDGYILLTRSIPFFENGQPYIKRTKTDEDSRIITMPDWYMEEMKIFKEYWEDEKELNGDDWRGGEYDYVFHSGEGVPYTPETVTGTWAKIKNRHDLKNIRLHDLRHTMVTYLLSQGESILNVQERAGHSSSKITTDIYGHVTKKVRKTTADRFNKFDPRKFVNNSSTIRFTGKVRRRKKLDVSTLEEQKNSERGD